MRRNAVQVGNPAGPTGTWSFLYALVLAGSPGATVTRPRASSGSSAVGARLSSLVSVTGVPGPTRGTVSGPRSVSVSHWSVGDGAREGPMRSVRAPAWA